MWAKITTEWLPESGYELIIVYAVEIYPPGDTQKDDYVCELWVPVKKGENFTAFAPIYPGLYRGIHWYFTTQVESTQKTLIRQIPGFLYFGDMPETVFHGFPRGYDG